MQSEVISNSNEKSKCYDNQLAITFEYDPGLKDDDGNELARPFTKNQMRKWLKKTKWENRKSEKRAREKAKAKERRIEAKILNIDLGPSRKALKRRKVADGNCNTSVIIDLSFDELMTEKNRFKVIKQILRCYSMNRRSDTPLRYHVTSFGLRTKNEMSRHNGYEHWDVHKTCEFPVCSLPNLRPSNRQKDGKKPNRKPKKTNRVIIWSHGVWNPKKTAILPNTQIKFEEKSYIDLYPKDKLVYLTSESENIIESFQPNTFYIIGGLVDHNEHKGICYKRACDQGIQHGRLPLERYIDMKTRKVLTIDHVFEIVLRICEGLSWTDTLMKVLPTRKGAVVCQSD